MGTNYIHLNIRFLILNKGKSGTWIGLKIIILLYRRCVGYYCDRLSEEECVCFETGWMLLNLLTGIWKNIKVKTQKLPMLSNRAVSVKPFLYLVFSLTRNYVTVLPQWRFSSVGSWVGPIVSFHGSYVVRQLDFWQSGNF